MAPEKTTAIPWSAKPPSSSGAPARMSPVPSPLTSPIPASALGSEIAAVAEVIAADPCRIDQLPDERAVRPREDRHRAVVGEGPFVVVRRRRGHVGRAVTVHVADRRDSGPEVIGGVPARVGHAADNRPCRAVEQQDAAVIAAGRGVVVADADCQVRRAVAGDVGKGRQGRAEVVARQPLRVGDPPRERDRRRAFVRPAVAVVVAPVAQLGPAGIDEVVPVVAVAAEQTRRVAPRNAAVVVAVQIDVGARRGLRRRSRHEQGAETKDDGQQPVSRATVHGRTPSPSGGQRTRSAASIT